MIESVKLTHAEAADLMEHQAEKLQQGALLLRAAGHLVPVGKPVSEGCRAAYTEVLTMLSESVSGAALWPARALLRDMWKDARISARAEHAPEPLCERPPRARGAGRARRSVR